jgi:peptide/nickel transport system substrate-binding protein
MLLGIVFFAANPPATAGERLKEIRIADGKGDWGYPNPYRHYPRGPGYIRMSWVFDTLVWKDGKGFIPSLATSWSYEPKSKSFLFNIRQDALWHDGKPFSADDVVFTIHYFMKHPYAWVPMKSIKGVEKTGPAQVAVHLEKPDASFLTYVGSTMPILPGHIWEGVEDPRSFHKKEAYIGTGPYRFVEFHKAKGTYLFEAFQDYYRGAPLAERLIYIKAGNPLMTLLSGKADLVNIKPEMAETLEKKGMAVLKNPPSWNKKLMINHRKEPLSDKRFRQALAHAIDKQAVIDRAHRGFGSPASAGLLSTEHPFHNPDIPTNVHDMKRAATLLGSLGYVRGEDGYFHKNGKPLRLELLASNISVAGESVEDRDGEVIAQQLEAAGIHVELLHLEQATTDARVLNWEFDLAISGHGGILGDARVMNRMIDPGASGSVNSSRYGANKELMDLMDAQLKEMDEDKRKQLVHRMQEIYAEDVPAIPLYYPETMAAYNPKKGIRWFYTYGGIALGIPIPQNKLSLIP